MLYNDTKLNHYLWETFLSSALSRLPAYVNQPTPLLLVYLNTQHIISKIPKNPTTIIHHINRLIPSTSLPRSINPIPIPIPNAQTPFLIQTAHNLTISPPIKTSYNSSSLSTRYPNLEYQSSLLLPLSGISISNASQTFRYQTCCFC